MRCKRRAAAATGVCLAALLAIALVVAQPRAAAQSPGQSTDGLTVAVDKTDLVGVTADTFTITSTISNSGARETPPLIANLSLVSVGLNAYVDPEDWSPERAISIDPIAPGSSDKHSWIVHAIQGGDYSIFIVALPDSASTSPSDRVVGSPAIHLHVELKRSLNPGGVTPVAIAVPLAVGLALATTRVLNSRRLLSRRSARQ